MSADGNSSAPPPKPAATFSSFINKNTAGKKFAPKAARRRPAVAATPAPVPEPTPVIEPAPVPEPTPVIEPTPATEPTPAPSVIESTPAASVNSPSSCYNASTSAPSTGPAPSTTQPAPSTSQPVPSTPNPTLPTPRPEPALLSASAPTETVPQLPTPAATQEPISPSDARSPLDTSTPLNTTNGSNTSSKPPLITAETLLPPLPDTRDEPVEFATNVPNLALTPPPTQLSQYSAHVQEAVVETTSTALGIAAIEPDTSAAQIGDEPSSQSPSRKKRRLPWAAINQTQDGETNEHVTAPPERTQRKAKTMPTTDIDHVAHDPEQQGEDGEASQLQSRRSGAKGRGKRKAAGADVEGDAQDQPPPKRTRKPRKSKPVRTEPEGDGSQPADGADVATVRRKPRQPKRRNNNATDVEGGEGESTSQPKRRGRPPREPTPSDAEEHTIDPDETYMDSLASRNIRVGKLSHREKEMRKVDWVAVKERRREEDCRPIQSRQEQEAADMALAEASAALDVQQVESGPRFREVDGRIEMIPDSGTINREADADREIAEYEVIENQDITARITSRSFLKNNKRFPNDFILPGQGRRWNADSTDLFYQGLKSFGTDFQMISQMFPGSTRRSMKTKFTREERENPQRVREALHGQSEIVSHWDVFLEASQRNEESFVDADEIKRQLAEDEAIMREKIEAAKLETEERNRQRAVAGVLDGGEGEEGNENDKSKKKRKDRGRQVTFREEEGVEIIGTIDDDGSWGQE